MLTHRLRLHRSQDFHAVQRRGKRWASEQLVLSTLPNSLDHNRYGFVVSKRIGNAVTRNRVKRRLRALIRSRMAQHPPGLDVVIIARPASASANLSTLRQRLIELEQRAGFSDL